MIHLKFQIINCIVFLMLMAPTFAQQANHRMTAEEKVQMPAYLSTRSAATFADTLPPFSTLRTPAEWEEVQALVITWASHFTILKDIVKYAQKECWVYNICSDTNATKTYLTGQGIPLDSLKFIQAPFNTIWIRDYGPWSVYSNDVDSLLLVDWIYNRPRPKDDTIPRILAKEFGLPHYETVTPPHNFIATGGNFMTDGFGTGFSSKLIIDENPALSVGQVDSIVLEFMGINRYIKMDRLLYDPIDHIDMHIKLLNEETLLVGQYPAGVADGPQIEANLQYVLSTYNSIFGTPYKVIRVPMPPDGGSYPNSGGDYRTYTNSIIVNGTIIVPTYEEQYDTTALKIISDALPGYNVHGINSNGIIYLSGAIHCITKLIATNDPLLISHQPLADTQYTGVNYTVEARIQHRSGIQDATIYYTKDTSLVFSQVSMSFIDTVNNMWRGDIPQQTDSTTVYYYVHANAVSGKQQVRPITAPNGYWNFNVMAPIVGMEMRTRPIRMSPVYPNPSKGITCIPICSPVNIQARLYLAGILGQEVATIYEGPLTPGKGNYFLNSRKLEPGFYFIVLTTEKDKLIQKLLVR